MSFSHSLLGKWFFLHWKASSSQPTWVTKQLCSLPFLPEILFVVCTKKSQWLFLAEFLPDVHLERICAWGHFKAKKKVRIETSEVIWINILDMGCYGKQNSEQPLEIPANYISYFAELRKLACQISRFSRCGVFVLIIVMGRINLYFGQLPQKHRLVFHHIFEGRKKKGNLWMVWVVKCSCWVMNTSGKRTIFVFFLFT